MRPVTLPAGVAGRLYLSAMPGRHEPFAAARAAIEQAEVRHVVCLAGAEEIRRASPAYHAALAAGLPWDHVAFPIPDRGVPAEPPRFCGLAKRVADLLLAGDRVLIHCHAGVGRTGLLATAALMALGEKRPDAVRAVQAAGSAPETEAQSALLEWIDAAPARVAWAYDRVAEAWARARAAGWASSAGQRRLLDAFAAALPQRAHVLDVGCGTGVPIAADLIARGFRVTGLDASAGMLALARRAVPQATLVHADMRLAEPGGRFDGIVAWDSVFHLPREDHPALFRRLARWLAPGGRLLVSLGGQAGGFTAEMLGEAFYFAAHAPEAADQMLRASGFRIDHREVDDPSSRGHIAILATRAVYQGAPNTSE